MTPEGTTLYIAAFGVLAEVTNPGQTSQRWTDYLSVGNAKVGMRSLQTASETLTTRYFHTDHLGSISVITNENGLVVERLSYDAWGKRRNPDGTDDTAGSITSQTTRGFTGEEQLSVAGLVHLNGRVYDPLLARFTSADPTVTDPMNMQGWNRYSYVGNDPLAFTDPNGFSWFSKAFGWVGKAFTAIGNFIKQNFMSIVQITINVVLNAATGFACAACVAAVSSAIVTGISGGNLGQVLKAAAIAAVTAAAFGGTEALASNPVAYVGANAAVGCASSVASGGSCASGAASAAVGAALSAVPGHLFPNAKTDIGQYMGATLARATIGGVASVAGGGKFVNGALTAAYQYLATTSAEAASNSKLMDAMNADRSGIDAYDPVQAKLQAYADRAVRQFDALGDAGFSDAQLSAIKDGKPWLRNVYRGYNIDAMVRDAVAADVELQGRLVGRVNSGVDFTDTVTGRTYEMTTPGQWSSKISKYGVGPGFIDTGRSVGGGGLGGGGGKFRAFDPLYQYHFPWLN